VQVSKEKRDLEIVSGEVGKFVCLESKSNKDKLEDMKRSFHGLGI
jgi:hypothetical protein